MCVSVQSSRWKRCRTLRSWYGFVLTFGDHARVILTGMKGERANPREIETKQALFVLNLEPKRMAGEVSEGMLFDIGYADGIAPVLAVPEKLVPNGVRAG